MENEKRIDLTKTLVDIVSAIVDDPKSVNVTSQETQENEITLTLTVAPDDVGRVIGKNGKIAQAIRQVMRTAANEIGKKVVVDIK